MLTYYIIMPNTAPIITHNIWAQTSPGDILTFGIITHPHPNLTFEQITEGCINDKSII